ncbi:hypothetical protein [Kineococcus sp. SYSU DK018]|uniref:hypothetical protein n=1 Tax=Kineococcus sp. SYSU DK018 TaxID=3383139 RepID=UPI003D7E6CE9
MSASWFSQPFRPDGGITAEGLRNQLGRPSLSHLTVLVREAAQNSWDARAEDVVRFSLDLRTVGPGHLGSWRSLLLPKAPRETGPLRGLAEVLRPSTVRYLAVSDRGTTGLGGPTRSDEYGAMGERGWLSFVLNSGEKQDSKGGGGTYGYGKGAFFLASRAAAILIYTRFREEGVHQTRLIGSALLESFNNEDKRPFTGRHWWGEEREAHCDPLLDAAADTTARQLGLPLFAAEETGTTIVVIDPDLSNPLLPEDETEDLSMSEAGTYLAEAAAWNLWPLTLPHRTERMDISVSVEGAPVHVPDVTSDAVLASFAQAYRDAVDPDRREEVLCGRPKRTLGAFASATTFGAHFKSSAGEELGLSRDKAPRHIALMRQPDLVIRYLEGPIKGHEAAGYVGVFKVDDSLDATFARSEPPTHDLWVDSQLTGSDATFVRVTHRRLNERCKEIAGPAVTPPKPVEDAPVGTVSHRLGFLLAGVGTGAPDAGSTDRTARSTAASGAGRSNTGHGAKGARRPQLIGAPAFERVDGEWLLVQRVRAYQAARITGRVSVIVGDGEVESSAPAEAEMPEVVGWRTADGVVVEGREVACEEGEFDLLVRPVQEAVIDIDVALVKG